jgi:Skp family chaperone for outer membrane proteins
MNLKYVDFEKVTTHFVDYRNGVNEINEKKKEFLNEVEPIRKEMNSIISSTSTGLIVDNRTQQQKAERFQQLQSELMQKDGKFKSVLKQMQDELNSKTFESLQKIISNWATDNSVDVISSKMETIYVNDNYDATDNIIQLLKDTNLFIEVEIDTLENQESR